jgi:hypothetical protein
LASGGGIEGGGIEGGGIEGGGPRGLYSSSSSFSYSSDIIIFSYVMLNNINNCNFNSEFSL